MGLWWSSGLSICSGVGKLFIRLHLQVSAVALLAGADPPRHRRVDRTSRERTYFKRAVIAGRSRVSSR
jgi:hypothetical protein